MTDCIFCQLREKKDAVLAENESFFLVRDKFPVVKGHSLIISKRHFETIFELTPKEAAELPDALAKAKQSIETEFYPDGYNVNNNNGREAGQAVFHCHFHVVPRYAKKSEDGKLDEIKVYDQLSGPIREHEKGPTS